MFVQNFLKNLQPGKGTNLGDRAGLGSSCASHGRNSIGGDFRCIVRIGIDLPASKRVTGDCGGGCSCSLVGSNWAGTGKRRRKGDEGKGDGEHVDSYNSIN